MQEWSKSWPGVKNTGIRINLIFLTLSQDFDDTHTCIYTIKTDRNLVKQFDTMRCSAVRKAKLKYFDRCIQSTNIVFCVPKVIRWRESVAGCHQWECCAEISLSFNWHFYAGSRWDVIPTYSDRTSLLAYIYSTTKIHNIRYKQRHITMWYIMQTDISVEW